MKGDSSTLSRVCIANQVELRREFIERHTLEVRKLGVRGRVLVFDIKVVFSDTKVVPI